MSDMKKTGKYETMVVPCPCCSRVLNIKIEEYLVRNRGAAFVTKFEAPSTFLCTCNTLLHLDFRETSGNRRHLFVTRTEKVEKEGQPEKLLLWEQGNPVSFSAWWIVDGNLISASESEVNFIRKHLKRAGDAADFGFSTYYSSTVYKVQE